MIVFLIPSSYSAGQDSGIINSRLAAYISFGRIQYGGLGGDQNIGKIWLVFFFPVIYA